MANTTDLQENLPCISLEVLNMLQKWLKNRELLTGSFAHVGIQMFHSRLKWFMYQECSYIQGSFKWSALYIFLKLAKTSSVV